MKKVKTFLHIFSNSIFPYHLYYHKLLRAPFVFSMKYFFFLIVTTYLLFALLYLVKFPALGSSHRIIQQFSESLLRYPENLIITVSNGHLTTNYDRPYMLWMDYNDKKILLLIVDQNATSDTALALKPMLLATGEDLYIKDIERIEHYKRIPLQGTTTKITRDTIKEISNNLQTFITFWPFISLTILFIIIPLLLFLSNMLYIFLASTLVYVAARFFLPAVTFIKIIQVALHAATLPLLVNFGLALTNVIPTILSAVFFVLLTVFIGGSVHEAYWKTPHTHKPH